MTEFRVEYAIEVEADTHEDAARKVAHLLANGGARRGSYEVKKRGAGVKYEIDLGEIDGTWSDAPDDTDWVAEIDAVLDEVEASTEADDIEPVFDARDAAAHLLRRIRELMAVTDAT